jgi:hypothetical protein
MSRRERELRDEVITAAAAITDKAGRRRFSERYLATVFALSPSRIHAIVSARKVERRLENKLAALFREFAK